MSVLVCVFVYVLHCVHFVACACVCCVVGVYVCLCVFVFMFVCAVLRVLCCVCLCLFVCVVLRVFVFVCVCCASFSTSSLALKVDGHRLRSVNVLPQEDSSLPLVKIVKLYSAVQ